MKGKIIMATFFQIKTKGDMYPEIIEIRIDDIKGDYIDYAIESIKELKNTTKNQIEGFRFVERENINGTVVQNFAGWIYYGHIIPEEYQKNHLQNQKYQETYHNYVVQLKAQEQEDKGIENPQIVGICRLDTGNYTPVLLEDQPYSEFIRFYHIHHTIPLTPLNTPKTK